MNTHVKEKLQKLFNNALLKAKFPQLCKLQMNCSFVEHFPENKMTQVCEELRHHGRWILTKKLKKTIFAVQIEKTEINILQKKWEKSFSHT